MKLKSFVHKHIGILLIIALFLIIKLSLYKIYSIDWDEAVYLSTAKYFYSLGSIGFSEVLRPAILPLLVGALWKLGFSITISGKILAVSISLVLLFITYSITKKLFNKKTALIAAFLLALTPMFLEHSFKIMPLFWSVSSVLLALYLLKNQRYALAGLLSGIAFLFRFTQGAVIAAVGIAFLIELCRKKNFKLFIQKSLKYFLTFFATVTPYLIFNYIRYASEVSRWHHAVFRPFIYATGTIAIAGGEYSPLFYIITAIKQNYLMLFIIIAIILFFRKKLYKDETYTSLLFIFLALLIYFSRLQHQEPRYMLDFFVYAVILSAYGLYSFVKYLAKNKAIKYLVPALFLLLFIFAFISRTHVYGPSGTEFKEALDIEGALLSTTPFPSVELDLKIEPNFYSLPEAVKDYRTRTDITSLLLYPYKFEFSDENKEIMKNLILNDNLILSKRIYSHDYLLFTKNEEPLPLKKRQAILEELGIETDSISLSKKPLDSFITVILIEDAGSAYTEDGKGNFWKSSNFKKINSIFTNTQINWNIVPSHLELLNKKSREYLLDTFNTNSINIIQKGHNHEDNGKTSEFFDLSYEKQLEKITAGKALIMDNFNSQPTTFIPPFNKADKNTLKALENLKFENYISGKGDPAVFEETSLNIYKDTVHATDWAKMKMKTRSEILGQLDFHRNYNNYVIISFYYPYMDEDDFNALADTISEFEQDNILFYTPEQLSEWQSFIENTESSIDKNTMTITPPVDDSRLTIIINKDGDYTIKGIKKFKIKNTADTKIKIIANNKELELEPGEIT